jgi:hypothetical protein
VNFWAEAFENEEPEVRGLRPFTSADLDLLRPDPSAGRILHSQAREREKERDPFGQAFTIVSHTFLIESKDGRVLTIDALKAVPGLTPSEVPKRNDRSRIGRCNASNFESHRLSQKRSCIMFEH